MALDGEPGCIKPLSAVTDIYVVARGTLGGRPVTKLLMCPCSGRRHQLRLHAKATGHPIVGDVAYCGDTVAPRMMLHAWRLRLPLPREAAPLCVTTADPFPFVHTADGVGTNLVSAGAQPSPIPRMSMLSRGLSQLQPPVPASTVGMAMVAATGIGTTAIVGGLVATAAVIAAIRLPSVARASGSTAITATSATLIVLGAAALLESRRQSENAAPLGNCQADACAAAMPRPYTVKPVITPPESDEARLAEAIPSKFERVPEDHWVTVARPGTSFDHQLVLQELRRGPDGVNPCVEVQPNNVVMDPPRDVMFECISYASRGFES